MSGQDTPITGGDPEEPYEAYALLHWGRSLKFGSPPVKLVLQILCERADAHGRSYPGQKLLAEESEQKERAVREQLAILESLGVLTREHRYDHRGKRTSDSYVLQARKVFPYTDFTERVREARRIRSSTELPAPDAGSKDASPVVDGPALEPSTTGARATDYRHQDASTTGAAAPGNYQREELQDRTTSDHPGSATTAGAGSAVDDFIRSVFPVGTAPSAPAPGRLRWCGYCDGPDTRLVIDTDRPCPDCHPDLARRLA